MNVKKHARPAHKRTWTIEPFVYHSDDTKKFGWVMKGSVKEKVWIISLFGPSINKFNDQIEIKNPHRTQSVNDVYNWLINKGVEQDIAKLMKTSLIKTLIERDDAIYLEGLPTV
jgi:hypothetical protein